MITLSTMKRLLKIALEAAAALLAVVIILFALVIWRAASQPIASTELTPYIESALSRLVPGSTARIASTMIAWNNTDGSIELRSEDVKLHDSANSMIAELPVVKFKLSVMGVLRGRFMPAELILDRPKLWFARHADGRVSFGGREVVPARQEGSAESSSGTAWQFTDDLTYGGLLRDMEITQASLFINDEATKQDWTVAIPEITAHRGWNTLIGQAKIEVTQKDGVSLMEAHYDYDRARKGHNVTLKFDSINPSFLAGRHPGLQSAAGFNLPLTGEITARINRDMSVAAVEVSVEGSAGTLHFPDLWEKTRTVKRISLKANYDREERRLNVPMSEIDFDGPKLSMTLDKPETATAASSDSLPFVMRLKLSNLPLDKFAAVWPKSAVPGARDWISTHMSKGQFTQGEATLHGRLNLNDLTNSILDSGDGKVVATNATVLTIEGLTPIQGVSAEGTFDLDGMDVQIQGGSIGTIKIQPFVIQMTDFQKTIQNIVIPAKFAGPVRDILTVIDQPPLEYAKKINLSANDVEGDAEGLLDLRFPLLKAIALKDIGVKVNAQLKNFAAPNLAPKTRISQGNLSLSVDKDGAVVQGIAALNNVPLQIEAIRRFPEVLGDKPRKQLTIKGAVAGEQWAAFGLDLGKTKGPSEILLRYVEPDNEPAQASGEINFRSADVQLGELNWNKAAGIPATLTFEAAMPADGDIEVTSLSLQGPEANAKGTAVLDSKDFRLLSADFSPFVIGRTNATLHFRQSPEEGGAFQFVAEGESFDVSGMSGGNDPARSDPRPKNYSLKLAKLYTSDTGFLTNVRAKARRDMQGWSEIDLHGLADGTQAIDAKLAKTNGHRTLSVTCDDFGKALKGMGFTDTVRDGKLVITGESRADNPRAIEGSFKVDAFVVEGLPVLARLLSAVSPFGFIDFVTGKSSFDHLDGEFVWSDDSIDFSKVRAVGSVYALNTEGRIDLNSGNADLHGTIVPFSFFNSVINVIPLLGDAMTGGEGQGVIAASYAVKGPLGDANISVNPVSLLTPGFLRNLFF